MIEITTKVTHQRLFFPKAKLTLIRSTPEGRWYIVIADCDDVEISKETAEHVIRTLGGSEV